MYLNTKLESYSGSISIAFIGCGKFIFCTLTHIKGNDSFSSQTELAIANI